MSETAITGLGREINPLDWDPELPAADRQDIFSAASDNLRIILPQVFFDDGIGSAKSQEYPTRSAVVARCAEVAVERAVALVLPSTAATLKKMYRRAPEEVQSSYDMAFELGISFQQAKVRVRNANEEFDRVCGQVVEGEIDYYNWAGSKDVARWNALTFMSGINRRISPLASQADLKGLSMKVLQGAAISDRRKQLLAAAYHLDDSNVQSKVDMETVARQLGYGKVPYRILSLGYYTGRNLLSPPQYVLDPLTWNETLTSEDRQGVHDNVRANYGSIISKVMNAGGLEPASAVDYPNREAVLQRYAEVVCERALSFMTPSQLKILEGAYRADDDKLSGVEYLMHERQISRQNARNYLNRAKKFYLQYACQLADGTMDYAKPEGDTAGKTVLSIVRHGALLFMDRTGMPIPRLASMGELKERSLAYLRQTLTLTPEQKSVTAALYHLDERKVVLWTELAALHDCFQPSLVMDDIARAINRIRLNRDYLGRSEKPDVFDSLTDADPTKAWDEIRKALRDRRLALDGNEYEFIDTYLPHLHQKLEAKEENRQIIEELGEDYHKVVRTAYKAIAYYCMRSGGRLEGVLDRDVGMVEMYVRDVITFRDEGVRRYHSKPLYLSGDDLRSLYAANPDIPKHYINVAVHSSSKDPIKGIALFRQNVERASREFANNQVLTPSMIRGWCARYPRVHMDRLRSLTNIILPGIEEHFASNVAVTPAVIRYFVRNNLPDTLRNVEAWLERREVLIQRFPKHADCPVWFLGGVAMVKPPAASPNDDLVSADHHIGLVNTYLSDLQALRKQYAGRADISRKVLVYAAQRYVGNGQRGVDSYFSCLDALRGAFAKDVLVDETVLQYYAMRSMGKTGESAVAAVCAWQERYKDLCERYSKSPLVDDVMVREVAMRWSRSPAVGFDVLIGMRQKGQLSLQATVSGTDGYIAYESSSIAADHSYSPDAMLDRAAEREAQQDAILRQIASLNEAEQQAVLIVYGLEDILEEEVDMGKLGRVLETDNLVSYVEEVIMPKLRTPNE